MGRRFENGGAGRKLEHGGDGLRGVGSATGMNLRQLCVSSSAARAQLVEEIVYSVNSGCIFQYTNQSPCALLFPITGRKLH